MHRGGVLSVASVLRGAPGALASIVVLAACGFSGVGTAPEQVQGADGGGPDAPISLDGSRDAAGDNDVPIPAAAQPSHVDVPYDPSAPDVSGLTVIDTGTPGTLNATPSTTPPLPAGARFDIKGGDKIAVLIVGGFDVNAPLVVKGARALIVVAARAAKISSSIDAGGKGEKPGPGGFGLGAGDGRGKDGEEGAVTQDSGGGGGSFGTLGAAGGDTPSGKAGGAPGIAYGDDPSLFLGGSPGGEGSPVNTCRPRQVGGGGGGAIQISSLVSVDVAAGGWINAGGGGGRGGCYDSGSAGGGGGSGGTIFLESSAISIAGTLASNGGGGGGGGDGDLVFGYNAESGENAGAALPNVVAAAGGDDPAQGKGGAGALEGSHAAKGQNNSVNNLGGGGGGMGRIWLRTFSLDGAPAKAPVISGATISPLSRRAP